MKYMFASDIHGSAYYCNKMLEAYQKEKADRLVLLGDLLYHGPRNDLPKDYAPKQVIAMLNQWKEHLYVVRGNCDAEVDQMVLQFPIMAGFYQELYLMIRSSTLITSVSRPVFTASSVSTQSSTAFFSASRSYFLAIGR